MAKWWPKLFQIHSEVQKSETFLGTCVRVVLSGASEIYFEKKLSEKNRILSEFLANAQNLIQRYQGDFFSWDGSQLVFVIREGVGGSASGLALSVVRNLFFFAEKFPNLQLKAALVQGQISITNLLDEPSLEGLPLAESLRILGAVKEENKNTLLFFRSELSELRDLCTPKELSTLSFRGSSSESRLCQVRQFTTLTQLLQNQLKAEPITYFRSDRELHELLTHFIERLQRGQLDGTNKVLEGFAGFRCENINDETFYTFKRYLNLLLRLQKDQPELAETLTLLVKVTPHLVNRTQFDDEFKELVVLALNVKNENTTSVVLEVLGLYCHDDEVIQTYLQSPVNRERVELLVQSAKKQISSEWLATMDLMLNSTDAFQVCLALHILTLVADHYYQIDAHFFEKELDFKKLTERISSYLRDPRDSVRRRALISQQALQYLRLAS